MREPGQRPSPLRTPASRPSSLPRVAPRAARRAAMGQLRSLLALAFCVPGIYASYLTQGVVQETLSTKKFGPQGERFSHLSSLNAVQCWVCFLWAGLLLAVFGKRCAGCLLHRGSGASGGEASQAPPHVLLRHAHTVDPGAHSNPAARHLVAAVLLLQRGGQRGAPVHRLLEAGNHQLRGPRVRPAGAQIHFLPRPGQQRPAVALLLVAKQGVAAAVRVCPAADAAQAAAPAWAVR